MKSTGATLVVLAALVAAACALSSPANSLVDDIPTDYLLSPGDNVEREAVHYVIMSNDTHLAGLAPEKMLEDFKERSISSPSAYDRTLSKTLYELGVEGRGACNTLTYSIVREIIWLAKQHPELPALADYVNFIRTIGKAKYAECVAGLPLHFDARMSPEHHGLLDLNRFLKYEDGLDSLYSTLANSEGKKLDDNQLCEVAKRLNPSPADFDVSEMLKIARSKLDVKWRGRKPSTFEISQRFWEMACSVINSPIYFGNYNMAVALGSQLPSDVPARFLKIREYNRICRAYGYAEEKNLYEKVEASGEAEEDNLQPQVGASEGKKGKWYKLGKN